MSCSQQVVIGESRFICDSAAFDGSTYLRRAGAFSGVADSKLMTLSFWYSFDTVTSGGSILEASISGFTDDVVRVEPTNNGDGTYRLRVRMFNFNGASSKIDVLLNGLTIDAGWHHYLLSVDLSDTAKRFLYHDNVLKTPTWTVYDNNTIAFSSAARWQVGANITGSTRFSGRLAELALWTEYVDLSLPENRSKFISQGRPVFMNTNGSGPTGTAPIMYLHLSHSEAAANFNTNRGTGGDFATQTGTLTTGTTTPGG